MERMTLAVETALGGIRLWPCFGGEAWPPLSLGEPFTARGAAAPRFEGGVLWYHRPACVVAVRAEADGRARRAEFFSGEHGLRYGLAFQRQASPDLFSRWRIGDRDLLRRAGVAP